jgi:hypothetical protein
VHGPILSRSQQQERNALREALRELLPGAKLTDFDDELFVGTHDGVGGVQWHVSLDRENMIRRFAVNLEGLSYKRRRPIAQFIQHEMSTPGLLSLLGTVETPSEIVLHFTRDAWKGARTRVPIREWYILAPRALKDLTATMWQRTLIEARNCLDEHGKNRGVASVTPLETGVRENLETCPHINFGVTLKARGSLIERLRELRQAKIHLEPIHEFVSRTCL